jgi:hypothetical protein
MDIDLPFYVPNIEEYGPDELESRISSQSKSSTKFRLKPASSRPGPVDLSSRHANDKNTKLRPEKSSETTRNAISDFIVEPHDQDGSEPMDIVEDETNQLSVNSDQWPGHLMDVQMPSNQTDCYSPSREAHMVVELINQIVFMWGISSMPIPSLHSSLKSEIATFSSANEEIVFVDSTSVESRSSSHKIADDEEHDVISSHRSHGELVIEEYSGNTKPGSKFQLTHNEEDEDDEPITKSRTHMYSIQSAFRSVDSYCSQLEKLKFLVWRDSQCYSGSNSIYLSHIIILIGPTISMARQGCCIIRTPRGKVAEPQNASSDAVPQKTRADDSSIRSTLREMLKYQVEAPSTRRQFSKTQAKIHLIACWSTFASNDPSMAENTSAIDDLAFTKVPNSIFTKWNRKRPIQTFRIVSGENDFPLYYQSSIACVKLGEAVCLL